MRKGELVATLLTAGSVILGGVAYHSDAQEYPNQSCFEDGSTCPLRSDPDYCPKDAQGNYLQGHYFCSVAADGYYCDDDPGYACQYQPQVLCGNEKDCVSGQIITVNGVAVACSQNLTDCISDQMPQ